MVPARTGRDNIRSTAVITMAHERRDVLGLPSSFGWALIMVLMKLAVTRMDLAPARCREKIVKSTVGLE